MDGLLLAAGTYGQSIYQKRYTHRRNFVSNSGGDKFVVGPIPSSTPHYPPL